jgi:hypothetical protein
MDFSDALIYLKEGKRVTRGYWELGKVIYLAPRTDGGGNAIYFVNAKGSEGIWIPSTHDLLSYDWSLEEVKEHA